MTSPTLNTVLVAAGVALIVTVGILTLTLHSESQFAGATVNPVNEPTGLSDLAVSNTASVGTYFCQGGTSCTAPNLSTFVAVGSCNAATSTTFSVKNPYTSTTTATFEFLSVTGNATTTTITAGTSTVPSLTAVPATASILNASIATTSQTYFAGGLTTAQYGPGAGFVGTGAGTTKTIVLAPGMYIDAYATTTATAGGSAGFVPGFTGCTYAISFKG